MTSQVLSEQSNAVTAFARLLRAHAALTRDLSSQLESDHGLTISDYEVLLRLAVSPDKQLKRVELASSVVLTPSGITRLLDGLEAAGLVARGTCASDRRVIYAVLTDEGEQRLRAAATDHFAAVDAIFAERFDEQEAAQLAALLGRLPGVDGDDACGVPD
jgi:DNA-binding MarR family transcriptional regulator